MDDEPGEVVGAERPDPASPLLHAIVNLAAFHRDHEKFYASAPREQAVTLQRHARTLQALADRWTTAHVAQTTPFSPFEGAEDLNDAAALQLEGVLFMEGEGEPAEIGRLKRDLRATAEESMSTGEWLASAMEASWSIGAELLEDPRARRPPGPASPDHRQRLARGAHEHARRPGSRSGG